METLFLCDILFPRIWRYKLKCEACLSFFVFPLIQENSTNKVNVFQSLNYDTVENDLTLQSESKREYKVS
jgi:hypothetical protein